MGGTMSKRIRWAISCLWTGEGCAQLRAGAPLLRSHYRAAVPSYRIAEAAELLGVSDDTVRRWIDSNRLPSHRSGGGPTQIDGEDLAGLAAQLHEAPDPGTTRSSSARNRLTGIVTRVIRDTVMAQVEIQAGPFRIVSLMSREAADELGLEIGVRAVATVKATQVSVDVP
jgi:molybdopterin-binding protein